jgi:AbrB family looped-hinge helix DNA binding protein
MNIQVKTAKISRKGQITLPKAARDALGTDLVQLEIGADGRIVIVAVTDLAGSLSGYAKAYVPIDKARTIAAKTIAAEAVARDNKRRRRR